MQPYPPNFIIIIERKKYIQKNPSKYYCQIITTTINYAKKSCTSYNISFVLRYECFEERNNKRSYCAI